MRAHKTTHENKMRFWEHAVLKPEVNKNKTNDDNNNENVDRAKQWLYDDAATADEQTDNNNHNYNKNETFSFFFLTVFLVRWNNKRRMVAKNFFGNESKRSSPVCYRLV